MFGILVAVTCGGGVAAALKFGAGLSVVYVVFTGMIVAAITYILVFRVINK